MALETIWNVARIGSTSRWPAFVTHVEFNHFPRGYAPQYQGNVLQVSQGELLEKTRFFLIVGRAVDRVVECPIFTYGGKLLSGCNRATHREYCSIRPSNMPADGFKNENPDSRVLDVFWTNRGHWLKASVVRLSDVRCRDEGSGVEVVAMISLDALKYASRMVLKLMDEAIRPARD
jgi:hypothetical protein